LKDILKIKAKLYKNEEDFMAKLKLNDNTENQGIPVMFNAADHLFISTRIARQLNNLPVANAIIQFTTPWPSQSYHHRIGASNSLSKNISESASIFAEYVFIILNIFVNMPNNLQDTVVQFLSTSIIDGLIVLFIKLYYVSPAFAVILVVCFLLSSCFVFRSMVLYADRACALDSLTAVYPYSNKKNEVVALHTGINIEECSNHSNQDNLSIS
jgi:hypothetical protein